MRTSSKPSRVFTGPIILATAGLSLFALNCGDDGTPATGTAGTSTLPMSGAGGSASQGGSSAGMAGGTATAGTTTTAGTAGTSTAAGSGGVGGGTGGAGGGTGGAGGGTGGAGGGSSGSGGGGGSAATFGPVKDLLAMSCKGAKCHDAASSQLDFTTSDGLYTRLTSPIPNDIPHCPGDALVNKGMPDQSLLVRVLKGSTMCSKAGGGMEQIARMPDHCGEGGNNPPCLTEAQIKVVSDWVAAGAPQ